MKRLKSPFYAAIMATAVFFFACVTINIYFPAEKVESIAGEIVKDIRGPEKAKEKDRDSNHRQNHFLKGIKGAFLPSLCWAEDITTVSNPTIRGLKEAMKARFPRMKPYYPKGILTEGDDGYVALGKTGGLGLKEKRDLNNLVMAENRDRKTLYKEVAKALKIDVNQTKRVAEIFAGEWQKSVK